jgi:cytochrome c556
MLALLFFGAVLVGVSTTGTSFAQVDPEEVMATRKVLEKYAELKDEEQVKTAAEMAKKNPIDLVMVQYKPRSRNGWGVGPKPDTVLPDSIELKYMDLARRAKPANTLKKEAPALVEMAKRTVAISNITYHYGEKFGKADPVKWKKLTDDVKQGSQELIKALEKATPDPEEVKTAASKANSGCVNCHSEFRDN